MSEKEGLRPLPTSSGHSHSVPSLIHPGPATPSLFFFINFLVSPSSPFPTAVPSYTHFSFSPEVPTLVSEPPVGHPCHLFISLYCLEFSAAPQHLWMKCGLCVQSSGPCVVCPYCSLCIHIFYNPWHAPVPTVCHVRSHSETLLVLVTLPGMLCPTFGCIINPSQPESKISFDSSRICLLNMSPLPTFPRLR